MDIAVHLDRDGASDLHEPVTLLVERDGYSNPYRSTSNAAPARSNFAASLRQMLAGHAAPIAARPPSAHRRLLDTLLAHLEHKTTTGHLHLAGAHDGHSTAHCQHWV